MTREILEQYGDMVDEIKELRGKLNSPVHDVVIGSKSSYPFTEAMVGVSGVPSAGRIQTRIDALKRVCAEIEAFIDSLPTSKQRRITRMKVMERMSWNEIAAKMGYVYSVDGVRKCYTRGVDGRIALDKELEAAG